MVGEQPAPEPRRRRILIAEDESSLRSLLQLSLGQCYDVEAVSDGIEAVEAFEKAPFDLAILDIMMPGMDGFAVCEHMRRMSDLPIIMLTALGDVEDLVRGFNLGADDYVTKPFPFKELMARVEAVFRRIDRLAQATPPRLIINGKLRVDTRSRQAWYDGKELRLTPVEFQLLSYLAARPGQVMSKEHLFHEVWGYDVIGGTNLVEVGVRRLREKVEPDPSHPQLILTARGAGYRFRMPPRADEP